VPSLCQNSGVAVDRTKLLWHYTPVDLFEAPHEQEAGGVRLRVADGLAVATVSGPIPEPAEEARIAGVVEALFRARQLRVARRYELKGPELTEYSGGKAHITIRLEGATLVATGGQVDFVTRNAQGQVIVDTKAERIAAHTSEMQRVMEKAVRSPVLTAMLKSFSEAIEDRDNELLHLYEIRDALVAHFRSELAARTALGISTNEWKQVGKLANGPVDQGRHRGQFPEGRRPASPEELVEVRETCRHWIVKFADHL
jgi:hypothetical protein